MEFTEELYHVAFDRALWACDEAREAMLNGPKDDPQLKQSYQSACLKINLLMARWDREGYNKSRKGNLIDHWFRRVKETDGEVL